MLRKSFSGLKVFAESGRLKSHEPYKLFFMVLPCIIFIFIFHYLPLWGWSFSFFNYKPGIPLNECEFVGFDHYSRMFINPVLRKQLLSSLRNTLAMALLGIIFGLLTPTFAIFLNEIGSKKFKRVVQTISTLPHFISWVIMYSLVFFMLSADSGFINHILIDLGIIETPINFLATRNNVWITMQLYSLWKGLGWSAIIYIAAIAGIDIELYEAAIVDGANRMQRIRYVTIPGLIPTYFVLLIISFGHFLSVGFEQFYVFQNAMNKEYIQVLDLYVYNQGIASGQISYATAIGIMKSFVSIILFSFANRMSKIVRGTSVF